MPQVEPAPSVPQPRPTRAFACRTLDEEDPTRARPAFVPKEVRTSGFFPHDVNITKDSVRKIIATSNKKRADYYKPRGCAQQIARSRVFEHVVFLIISLNAVWIGIETDYNSEDELWKSEGIFVLVENLFCVFFTLELVVRFAALREKKFMLRDPWLLFDSILVFSTVLEIWGFGLMSSFIDTDKPDFGPLIFMRLTRFLRLLRVARMARLARSCPEILVIVDSMLAGMRSVFFMLVTLLGITYFFAVIFCQLSDGTSLATEHKFFGTVSDSMFTLVTMGLYMDEISTLMSALRAEGIIYVAVFAVFSFICSHGLMNFMIGVLCEVVSTVAEREKLQHLVLHTKDSVTAVVGWHPEINPKAITKDNIFALCTDEKAITTLDALGVDPLALVELVDVTFKEEEVAKRGEIEFEALVDLVMSARGSNAATVKDLVHLRRSMYTRFDRLSATWPRGMSPSRASSGGELEVSSPTGASSPPFPGGDFSDASGPSLRATWIEPAPLSIVDATGPPLAFTGMMERLSARTADISNELYQLTRLLVDSNRPGPALHESRGLQRTLDAAAAQLAAPVAGAEGHIRGHGAPGRDAHGADPGRTSSMQGARRCVLRDVARAPEVDMDAGFSRRRQCLPQEVPPEADTIHPAARSHGLTRASSLSSV